MSALAENSLNRVQAPSPDAGRVSTQLRGRRLFAARSVWLGLALFSLVVVAAAVVVRIQSLNRFSGASLPGAWTMESFQAALATVGLSVAAYVALNLTFAYLIIIGFMGTGLLIFFRRSDDWVALFVSLVLILWPLGILDFSNLIDLYPVFRLPVNILSALGTLTLLPFFFLFPNGQFVPRAAPWIIILWAVFVMSASISPGTVLDATTWPAVLNFLLQASFLIAGVVSQVYRYRYKSNAVERKQTKWVVLCAAIMASVFVSYVLVKVIFPQVNETGVPGFLYVVALPFISFFFLLMPIGIALSILRYRLWDIDFLISRTLVYIPLTAILAGLFAASVTLFQRSFIALSGQQSDFAAILGTLVVVAALTPIKERLQSLVDRRFKQAPESIRRLNAFGEQVSSRVSLVESAQIAKRLLEECVAAFQVTTGAVYMESENGPIVAATVGEWKGEAILDVPLQAGENGRRLGHISLGARRDRTDYTEKDREALRQVASTVAVAIEQDGPQLRDPIPSAVPL